MKKIEMIRVRTSQEIADEILPSLIDYIDSLQKGSIEQEIEIVRHSLNKGELAVFLTWKDNPDNYKSREGILLANIMQEIGALSHIVWLEGRGLNNAKLM